MVIDGYIQYGLDCHKVLTPNKGHLTTIFCMCGTPYDHTYTEGNVLTDNSACVFETWLPSSKEPQSKFLCNTE